MDYELAKKLKDAGFPQGKCSVERPNSWVNPNNEHSDWFVDEECIYNPTLSELIEACGKDFLALYRIEIPNGEIMWAAESRMIADEETYGSETPEEAVANLWLELNKKI